EYDEDQSDIVLPPAPEPTDPGELLRSYSDGLSSRDADSENGEEAEEEEYDEEYDEEAGEWRSFSDRIGDWIGERVDTHRERRQAEAPLLKAQIARQVALLEGQTQNETEMAKVQGELARARRKPAGQTDNSSGSKGGGSSRSSSSDSGTGPGGKNG
ncbi:hypothetical protein ACFC1B_30795, partial [Streptomyces xiamenensis]